MAKKRINLALQGGGAHGAFTWGVLDRLLEDDEIEIASMSGTSAGALNGAALKSGWITGGRAGARENLAWLWGQVAGVHDMRMTQWMAPFGVAAFSQALEYSWPMAMTDALSKVASPYAYGPFYRNPLQSIVEQFDYDRVCKNEGPEFFVCATRVSNGKIRIFKGDEIGPEALMASACLPTLFKAVEMYDSETDQVEAFWDGGYTGNPALFPMFDAALPEDIVIVNINPLQRKEIPRTPQAIQNRLNEISFNSSLLRELRAIEFVQRLLDDGSIPKGRMSKVRIHMIADDDLMEKLSVATKLVPNAAVISTLKDAGRAAAEGFLAAHRDDLNERSSVDMPAMFG